MHNRRQTSLLSTLQAIIDIPDRIKGTSPPVEVRTTFASTIICSIWRVPQTSTGYFCTQVGIPAGRRAEALF